MWQIFSSGFLSVLGVFGFNGQSRWFWCIAYSYTQLCGIQRHTQHLTKVYIWKTQFPIWKYFFQWIYFQVNYTYTEIYSDPCPTSKLETNHQTSSNIWGASLNLALSSCYRTVPSAIWEISSEFLIFCNLFHEPLAKWNNSNILENEENICQYCMRQRAITTLSLNACLKKLYQELPYLLIVSDLLTKI